MIWTAPEHCRGLIFDCDGTLVDSMPLHYEAWAAVLMRHGMSFTNTQFYEWAGTPVVEVVRRLASSQNRIVDAPAIAAERDAYFHSLPVNRIRPLQPVVDVARRYHGVLPLAVATGSTLASATTSLTAIGVRDLFGVVVSAEDVQNPKPAPDVFLLAAKRIRVEPSHCAVFEDADAGLAAALAAGMLAIDVRTWS